MRPVPRKIPQGPFPHNSKKVINNTCYLLQCDKITPVIKNLIINNTCYLLQCAGGKFAVFKGESRTSEKKFTGLFLMAVQLTIESIDIEKC